MRSFLPFAFVVVVLFSTTSRAQQGGVTSEPSKDISGDQCRIELTLPSDAKVTIDDRDYGEQRSITLPISKEQPPRNRWGNPYFILSVQFSNGGQRSTWIEAKGGTVVRVAIEVPPIESLLLEGPWEDIASIAFSPDGKWIVMGTWEHQAILWETATGWIRWNGDVPMSNAAEDKTSVAFSADGSQILVGTELSGIALLDAATGKRLNDVIGDSEEEERTWANAVAFSPDDRLIAAALSWQKEPTVAIWDAKTGKRLQTLHVPKSHAHKDCNFNCIAFSPDGRRLVAGASNNMAILFDVATGKMLQRFHCRSGSVSCVAWSPDSEKFLMGTSRNKAVLWSLKKGTKLRTFSWAPDEYVHGVASVAFSPDGRRALAGCGNLAYLFDIATGTSLQTFDSSDDDHTHAIFSPDGRHVLTAGSRRWRSCREAILWEASTGKRVRNFHSPKDEINSVAFSEDGRSLKVGYKQGWTTIWDMNTGKPVGQENREKAGKGEDMTKKVPQKDKTSDTEDVNPLEQNSENQEIPDEYKSPDGRWIVEWVDSHTVVTIDPQTLRETTTYEGNDVILTDARMSKRTKLLDYGTKETIRVAFSPKTLRIAVADENSVHIFNPETGKELATFISAYDGQEWLVLTPDNYFAGSTGGQSLLYWRVGEAEYPFPHFKKDLCRPDLIGKALMEE